MLCCSHIAQPLLNAMATKLTSSRCTAVLRPPPHRFLHTSALRTLMESASSRTPPFPRKVELSVRRAAVQVEMEQLVIATHGGMPAFLQRPKPVEPAKSPMSLRRSLETDPASSLAGTTAQTAPDPDLGAAITLFDADGRLVSTVTAPQDLQHPDAIAIRNSRAS